MRRQVCYTPRHRNRRGAKDARRRPTYPHPSSCLTGRNERESRRRERQRHTPGRRQGKNACQEKIRAEEREKSDEATNKIRGSQHPRKGRAQGGGHGRHTAHGGHQTAPKHRRGEHQRDKRKAAPRTTTRHAQTPHTPHTPTPAPTARGQRAPAARPEGRQPEEGERLTPDAPHNGGHRPPLGTPYRQLHGAQRRPARARAVGPVLGPHARTDRTRDTQVAEPRLTTPEDGRSAEGQYLTPDAPHNGGRPTPPGTAPDHPHGKQPPQGMQAKGTVLGPHTHTPAPTACGWRTRAARQVGGQFGKGERLSTDAPDNGGRHPPGNALRPPPQRATPARKGARCGAGAGSRRPHRPHPGHTGRGTPATGPRGQAAGGGIAPDTRRPSQRWQAIPPGTAPHHPHGTQPRQGMQAKGTVMGPNTHTPAPAARGWLSPTARPVGGQLGEGERLTSDALHNGGRQPPPGTPSRQPHCEQRRPA